MIQYSQYKKFCSVIDNLIITFTFNIEILSEFLSKEHEGIISYGKFIFFRNNIEPNFEHCFMVSEIKGNIIQTLGYMYFGSYNPRKKFVYFKYLNERLYDKEVFNPNILSNILGLELDNLPISFHIACDFKNVDIIKKLDTLFTDKDFNKKILGTIREQNDYVNEIERISKGSLDNKNLNEGITISKVSTDKYNRVIKNKDLLLICYNKSLEIETISKKHYISTHHGFNNIFRAEVRVNRTNLAYSLKQLGISQEDFFQYVLNNEKNLLEVWKHIFSRILAFRSKGKRECEDIIDLLMNYSDKGALDSDAKKRKPRQQAQCIKRESKSKHTDMQRDSTPIRYKAESALKETSLKLNADYQGLTNITESIDIPVELRNVQSEIKSCAQEDIKPENLRSIQEQEREREKIIKSSPLLKFKQRFKALFSQNIP